MPREAGRLIAWAADQHGDRPAIVCGGEILSHRSMDRRANRVAHALIALGLRPGDRIAVLLENSVASVDSVFGAEKAGLAYVALNARHAVAEHLAILADAGAGAVLLGPQFGALAEALVGRSAGTLPDLRHVLGIGLDHVRGVAGFDTLCAAAPEHAPGLQVAEDHIVRISYTSGTTGRPKGVVHTLERVEARLANHFMAMEFALGIDDAMLHVGPLTHAAGVHLFPCFLRGALNVILDRFEPRLVLDAIARHRVTQIMLVPTMMARLVAAIEGGMAGDWSSLRRIHYGTAPTPPDLLRRALAVFGPILRQQYGMTEAPQPLAILYPHEHLLPGSGADDPLGACGRPAANVRLRLRGADGADALPSATGEIVIAHEGVGRVEFWRRPDLLAEAVRDGWFHTGDLGRLDANGLLHIVGRTKDMIISGGFNVQAREVEDALAGHPAVQDAAVLGLPDPEWGETVAAAVVLRAGAAADAAALADHCALTLAGYKKPRRFVFVADLPRNAAGKVVKDRLRPLFTNG